MKVPIKPCKVVCTSMGHTRPSSPSAKVLYWREFLSLNQEHFGGTALQSPFGVTTRRFFGRDEFCPEFSAELKIQQKVSRGRCFISKTTSALFFGGHLVGSCLMKVHFQSLPPKRDLQKPRGMRDFAVFPKMPKFDFTTSKVQDLKSWWIL